MVDDILPYVDWENEALDDEETVGETGNLTPLFDFEKHTFMTDSNGRMVYDEGLKGMETIIAKAHETVRGLYVIYSDNYGSDEKETLREDVPEEIRKMMVEEAIIDCLIHDDRVKSLSDIELERLRDGYLAKYTVYTIFGDIPIEREV